MNAESRNAREQRVRSFLDAYHRDPDLRSRCESDPHAVLAENGVEVPLGYEVRFVANTADVFHFTLPPDPNAPLTEEELAGVVGGKGEHTPSYESLGLEIRSRLGLEIHSK